MQECKTSTADKPKPVISTPAGAYKAQGLVQPQGQPAHADTCCSWAAGTQHLTGHPCRHPSEDTSRQVGCTATPGKGCAKKRRLHNGSRHLCAHMLLQVSSTMQCLPSHLPAYCYCYCQRTAGPGCNKRSACTPATQAAYIAAEA